MKQLYTTLLSKSNKNQKGLAVLIDPDYANLEKLEAIRAVAEQVKVDYFFVGGSLIVKDRIEESIAYIKSGTDIPVVLFPGNNLQINPEADALLLLSLISGRNPEFLIGQHVVAAPYLKESRLEIISTGYMLIDGGNPTAVQYMSDSNPIPSDKNDIAVCTALAGEMLGMKVIYLDAGSGARQPVAHEMISAVRSQVSIPLIVGGGIKTPEQAELACSAGADVLVVGNALEKDPLLLAEISLAIHSNQGVV